MNAGFARKIEPSLERLASAIFAAAVAFAAFVVVGGGQVPLGLAAGLLAASAVYPLCHMILAAIAEHRPAFRMPSFELAEPASDDELVLTDADRLSDELVLTDSDRLGGELMLTDADRLDAANSQEPLILDDVLEAIGPESRVVRLFDRRAMPTPGDLKSRIDHHVGGGSPSAAPHDASQELSDALAELRKALR